MIMIRPKGKAKQIAYKILGVPPNMQKQPESRLKKYVDRRLLFEETFRVR